MKLANLTDKFFKHILELAKQAGSKKLLVAYSGGVDSHVLLDLVVQLLGKFPEFKCRAVHINHGLQPNATQCEKHCATICATLDVPLLVKKLQLSKQKQLSLEAQAREARYAAIAELLLPKEVVLTAHHQNDQLETLLLQLLRGAGVAGLAAMPKLKSWKNSYLLRPLLEFSRVELRQYAIERDLVWVDDVSNKDLSFDRNYLRQKVVPLLAARWPGLLQSTNRSARHCATTQGLLEELAAQDFVTIETSVLTVIKLAPLLQLSVARQNNVLRHWVRRLQLIAPSEKKLQQIRNCVLYSRYDATPYEHWGNYEIRRYRDQVYIFKQPLPKHDVQQLLAWNLSDRACLRLPSNLGVLTAQRVQANALASLLKIDLTEVSVRFYRGGEKLRLAGDSVTRQLKKYWQLWGVPPWQRQRVPLLYVGERLAAVIGYGIAAELVATKGEPGWCISYLPTTFS